MLEVHKNKHTLPDSHQSIDASLPNTEISLTPSTFSATIIKQAVTHKQKGEQ